MKILIITQAVDINHTTLGFFTRWIEEFAKKTEKVSVICLYQGKYILPKNVSIYSLGKETGQSKIKYLKNFFKYIWQLRKDYDVVFVHMNQEYVILSGVFWKIFGKKIFLWRNHPKGSFLTKIAVFLSDKVFATAKDSFVFKLGKAKLMPAGIDTKLFRNTNLHRVVKSLLVFGRISPIKKIEVAIDLATGLLAKGIDVRLSIIGDFLEKDYEYFKFLKKRIDDYRMNDYIKIERGVAFADASSIYNHYEILLNFTESGSFDKTIIEALACGCKVLVSNTSFKDLLPEIFFTDSNIDDSINKLTKLLSLSKEEEIEYQKRSFSLVKEHSLSNLIDKILIEFNV